MGRNKTNSEMLASLTSSLLDEAQSRHGWTQAEFAARAGLRPETMSRIKGGCHFDTLERLARTAGMRIVAIPDNSHVEQVLTGSGFSFDDVDD